jgi:hypothetical protein
MGSEKIAARSCFRYTSLARLSWSLGSVSLSSGYKPTNIPNEVYTMAIRAWKGFIKLFWCTT